MTLKACLRSMRLRTLPLSLAGIVLGELLAAKICDYDVLTVVLLALTTVCLQILSNLSNELGDTLSGTDRSDRQGIHYSIQDGEMTVPEMKRLIGCFAVLSCLVGFAMVWRAFGTVLAPLPAAFLALGAAAVWAAMHYTLGKHPYGYRGLGDIFVFIFFGLATVCGGYYPRAHLPDRADCCGLGADDGLRGDGAAALAPFRVRARAAGLPEALAWRVDARGPGAGPDAPGAGRQHVHVRVAGRYLLLEDARSGRA